MLCVVMLSHLLNRQSVITLYVVRLSVICLVRPRFASRHLSNMDC